MDSASPAARGVPIGVVVAGTVVAVGALPTLMGLNETGVPTGALYGAGWPALGLAAALLIDRRRDARLGIIMTVNLEIGMVTPPVELTLFVTAGIANMSIVQVVAQRRHGCPCCWSFWCGDLIPAALALAARVAALTSTGGRRDSPARDAERRIRSRSGTRCRRR